MKSKRGAKRFEVLMESRLTRKLEKSSGFQFILNENRQNVPILGNSGKTPGHRISPAETKNVREKKVAICFFSKITVKDKKSWKLSARKRQWQQTPWINVYCCSTI